MTIPEGLLLVLLIFPAAVLAGYVVVARLVTPSAGIRLGLAGLAGLGIWLWLVAMLNLVSPINFWAAWCIIVLPWLGTFALPSARQALLSDLRLVFASVRNRWLLLAPLPLVVGLLLPLMVHPGLVFYDGTSNHDSFFWITGAEWLQLHTYLTFPDPAVDPAVFSVSGAITGIYPAWGRMGTEGLLALLASALRVQPLKVYVYAQVGLLPFWLASAVVFVRLVFARSMPAWVFCLGASLQPVFVFFVTNNSMPNLLGALVAPVMLVAFVRLTEADGITRGERVGWGVVAALMLHGLLCTYPEMAPFALVAAGIAAGAKLILLDRRARWRGLLTGVIVAGLAGLLIQPLTAWRAIQGFLNSLSIARSDVIWGNLFEGLEVGSFVPALTTLNIPACKALGSGLGWALSLLLLLTFFLVVRRAEDKSTALAGLAGFALLGGYTLATHFSYGWQKSVQFSGVIVAGYATFGAFLAWDPAVGVRGALARRGALAALTVFLAFATVWSGARNFYWADTKALDVAFLSLRNLSRDTLRRQPVEVVGATFGRSFFYSMWAVYALPESRLSFDPRGEKMGGYLYGHLPAPGAAAVGTTAPRAYLVSRKWAETFDADAVRLSTGAYHALVAQTNKVVAQSGLFPLEGVPQSARAQFSLTILPFADGTLECDITRSRPRPGGTDPMRISYGQPDQRNSWQTLRLDYPWQVRLPVQGGVPTRIEIETDPAGQEDFPLQLQRVRLTQSSRP